MRRVLWSQSAKHDLIRLDAFLAAIDPHLAIRVVDELYASAQKLLPFPEIGVLLDAFAPRNVRRIMGADYELRYEVTDSAIYILRIWHTREDR